MKLLFASIRDPERENDGLSIYSLALIKLLESVEGVEVTTWYPTAPFRPGKARIRSLRAWGLWSSNLPTIYRPDLLPELLNYARETHTDVIVLNHIMTAWMIPHLSSQVATVYVAHNAEYVSSRSAARLETLRRRLPDTIESILRRRLERHVLASARGLITLSHLDLERLGNLSPRVSRMPRAVIPPVFHAAASESPTRSQDVLLLGSFEWTAKRANARWLARAVFPLVRQRVPGSTLVIAGHRADFLGEMVDVPGIQIQPNPRDVDHLWARAALCAVPERQQGGVKLKVVEAAARGVPVVSTTPGAEGTHLVPGRSILIADEPALFADHIVELLTDPGRASQIASAALKDMSTYPDEEEKRRRVHEMLAAVGGR